jgi:hypothetical protein
VRGWLSGALAAARIASDRADLWLPGSLAPFAAAGWIVLLLTVTPLPAAAGAAGLGLQILASPWWPWNAVMLVVAVASGLATLLLVVAFGEVALLLGLADRGTSGPLPTVPRATGLLALATLPVLALAAVFAWLAAPAVVDVISLPDPSTSLPVRVLAVTWPYLLGLAAVIVVAQSFGAAALRGRGRGLGPRAISRRVPRLLPQAAVTAALFVIGQVATALVLALLWQPLDDRLLEAGLAQPTTVVLLVGFVWIWLVLVILAGVVQAWTSAWWNATLDAGPGTEFKEGDR